MNSKQRLTALKNRVAKDAEGKTWQSIYGTYKDPGTKHGTIFNPKEGDGCRWVENVRDSLRFVGYADEIAPHTIRHKGWYSDNWQDETFRGVVFRLPSRNGQKYYGYGYEDPNNDDGACLEFGAAEDDISAALWADQVAEHYAEEAREFHAKDMAEQRQEQIKEELASNRGALLAALKERRAACKIAAAGQAMAFPALVAVIKQGIKDLLNDRNSLMTEKAKLEDDFWNAVNT